MISSQLSFITLVVSIFVVNGDDYWKNQCLNQLETIESLNMESNKIFMYVYYELVIPLNESLYVRSKGFLFSYQRLLLANFLEVHRGNLQNIFDSPIEWCVKSILGNANDIDGLAYKFCESSMNSKRLPKFTESREKALDYIFLHMREKSNDKVWQQKYFNYIGPRLRPYAENMSAIKPSEYCNKIAESALQLVVDEYEKAVNGPCVYQGTHSHIDDPHASSYGGNNTIREIDLNQFPSDEDEGIDLNQFPPVEDKGIDLNQFPSVENNEININQFP